ncbi:uncharacterized protein LOC142996764 [Genypterus blacodes]|uniref:uncharacterized protein LOC142996764 n=1 Tax=Genypterus blacodes TaxID=154954 RepID=UPI003F768333
MIWTLILLGSVLCVDSYAVHDIHERLAHGRQLKMYLPKAAEKLEFTPAYEPGKTFLYWEKARFSATKGRVSGTGSDRRWYIDKVTYEDEGSYTQRDFWNNEISILKVAVTPRHNYVKHVPGKSLVISLEGIELSDASLSFTGEAVNVTLVRDGARVSQDILDYYDRVQIHNTNIEILHVNVSDVGRYTLKDRRDRVVSTTRMDLTDHDDDSGGNPLLALLLLLGIPAGICCCCRKKIFKQKASTAATQQASPAVLHPASGPSGLPPSYNTEGQPGTVYYNGPAPDGTIYHPPPAVSPPFPGYNPAYQPQNPLYPPAGSPMMMPPQPQWNGPPPGQYPPGPVAPMGYAPAPVMYSAPPPEASSEPINPPTSPLLTAPQQTDSASAPVPPSNDAYMFQINKDKGSSTNFL